MLPVATPGPFPPSFPPTGPSNPGDWVWSVLANLWSFLSGTWHFLGQQAAPLATAAAIATAVIAILALRSTARDTRERSRPVVLALFREAPNNDKARDFVVRNYGPSAARNLEVKFDPEFSAEDREDRLTEILAQRYDVQIPLLPPDAEIVNLWWSGPPKTNMLKTPTQVTVTITYKGNRFRRYKEVIPLDVEWARLDSSSFSSGSMPGMVKQISESLDTLATQAIALQKHLQSAAGSEPDLASTEKILAVLAQSGGFQGVDPDGAHPATPGETVADDGDPSKPTRPPATRRSRPKPPPSPPSPDTT